MKTHHDRSLLAAKTDRPENFGEAALRTLKATFRRGPRLLFHDA